MAVSTRKKNWLEWVVFAAGSIMLAAAILFLGYKAVQRNESSFSVGFKVIHSETTAEGFVILVEATNEGDESYEDLLIEATLDTDEGQKEQVEVELSLLPHDSSREFTVHFRNDPRTSKVTFRPVRFVVL